MDFYNRKLIKSKGITKVLKEEYNNLHTKQTSCTDKLKVLIVLESKLIRWKKDRKIYQKIKEIYLIQKYDFQII
mgnify:CR=1 FL=1